MVSSLGRSMMGTRKKASRRGASKRSSRAAATQGKSSLLTLPNELLFEVVSHLKDFKDLNSVVCTSRFFHESFNPLLYRRVVTMPNHDYVRDDIVGWALLQEEVTTLEHLLDNGLSPNYVMLEGMYDEEPMLYSLCDMVEDQLRLVPFAKLLIDRGASIEEASWPTVLHVAALKGNFAMAELMLEWGIDVNARNVDGRTPLHYAAGSSEENGEMVEFLLENGADIEARDYNRGETPLLFAFRQLESRKTDIVPTLLEWNADASVSDKYGMAPLHYATLHFTHEEEEFTEALLENGADVNATDNAGRTPLHLAMKFDQIGEFDYFMTEFLLENGAHVNAANNEGDTPLQVAFDNYRWKPETLERMAALLFKYGADETVMRGSWRWKEVKRIRARGWDWL